MSDRIRILLVDDQQLVRTGFRMIVADEPDIEVVGEAADGRAAVEAVGLRPDVVVMDLRMPIMDGVEGDPAPVCHPGHRQPRADPDHVRRR